LTNVKENRERSGVEFSVASFHLFSQKAAKNRLTGKQEKRWYENRPQNGSCRDRQKTG